MNVAKKFFEKVGNERERSGKLPGNQAAPMLNPESF
jgi:hypothetical protein